VLDVCGRGVDLVRYGAEAVGLVGKAGLVMLYAFALRKRITMGAMLDAIASATAAAAAAAAAAHFAILAGRLTLLMIMAIVLSLLLAVRVLAFGPFSFGFGIFGHLGSGLLRLIFRPLAAIAPASATAAAAASTGFAVLAPAFRAIEGLGL
jgi:hypothetical protein